MRKLQLLSLVALLVFASCTKSEVNESDTPALPNKMLVFNNMDELLSASTKVSNMTEDEVKAYQSQNGYESFAQIAEEVYYSIDLDSFTSEQEMLDFLEANKDYITLKTEDNGGFTARPAFHDNMYKHLINEDKMFEVDDLLYKVFQNGMVSAPKDQMNELMDLSSANLEVIQSTNNFAYVPFQSEPLTKSPVFSERKAQEIGENRVRMTVEVYYDYATCRVEIDRERWLGWFAKKRDVVLDASFLFHLVSTNTGHPRSSHREEYTSLLYIGYEKVTNSNPPYDAAHIHTYSFTAVTPATGISVTIEGELMALDGC